MPRKLKNGCQRTVGSSKLSKKGNDSYFGFIVSELYGTLNSLIAFLNLVLNFVVI